MKGCRIKGSAAREPRAYMFNHKIQTRHVMSSHISTMSQVLGAIRFPCYLEKNYKHRDAKEESHGILRAKCLGLGTLQSGKRRLPKSKVFVVTFVCKGTSLCLPNPSVSKFSRRKSCGYGIRFFSKNEDPCTVHVEEFGSHTGEDGLHFVPPESDKRYLTLTRKEDAMCAFDLGLTPAKYLTACAERALLSGLDGSPLLPESTLHEIRNCYRLVRISSLR